MIYMELNNKIGSMENNITTTILMTASYTFSEFDEKVSIILPCVSLTLGLIGNILAIASLLYRRFRPLRLIVYQSIRRATSQQPTAVRTGNFHGIKEEAKKFGVIHIIVIVLLSVDIIGIVITSTITINRYATNLEMQESLLRLQIFNFVFITLLVLSLIMLIAIDRIIALKFAFRYNAEVGKRAYQVLYVIGIIFLFEIVFSLLPITGVVNTCVSPSYSVPRGCSQQSEYSVYLIFFVILGLILVSVTLVCNVLSLIEISRNLKKKIRMVSNYCEQGWRMTEVQKFVQILLVTISCFSCWLPLLIRILKNQVKVDTNYSQDIIAIQLTNVNLIVNPWLYWLLRESNLKRFVDFLK
ncbi:prostaglandin E2 receptor EP3 subtype-like isoform X1 [Styela clava]